MSHPAGLAMAPLLTLGKSPADCWTWNGRMSSNGYPTKTHNGVSMGAHRWMWLTLFGPIPEGLVVSRTCGSRACVNPHHLCLQTIAAANRAGIGAKLTVEDIRELRSLVDNGVPRDLVAERYGVTEVTISDVMRRKSWKRKSAPGGRPARNRGPRAA